MLPQFCLSVLLVAVSGWQATRVQRQQRYQPPPDSQMAGEFSVSGTVADASTGEPIRKANVNISGGGAAPGNGSTLTDGSGSFRFTHLEAGQYTVRADKPGYTADGGRQAQTSASVSIDHPTESVTCKLQRNGTISGKVVDENDEPLAYASVQAMRKNVRNGHRQWMPSGGVQSNDLGEYRMTVQPGEYMLEVTLGANMGPMMGRGQPHGKRIGADVPAVAYPALFYPNAKEIAAAVPLAVGSGQEQRADFRLTPGHAITVSGRVTNALPNHGMSLMLAPAGSEMGFRRGNTAAAVGGDGTFQVGGVLPGRYILIVDLFAPPSVHLTARVPITAGDADISDVPVTLVPAFDIAINAHKEDGTPAGVQVMLNSTDMAQQYQANGSGPLALQGVVPGTYQVLVNSSNGGYVKSATLGGTNVLDRTVEISAAPEALQVLVSANGGSVSGEVSNGDARARNARVLLLRRLATGEVVEGGSGTANDAGQFTVDHLAPGEYLAFAMTDTGSFEYGDPGTLKRYQDFGQSVTVQEKSVQQLKLNLANVAQ